MHERIAKGLAAQFEEHRIVFWSDPAGEMRDAFADITLDGVEKLPVENNEFALKHLVLRGEPKQKFLIYRSGPVPADPDNWLLDIELSHGAFKADQIAMWRTELGLPDRFDALLGQHEEFFKSGKRLEKLKSVSRPEDTETVLRLRMLAICAGADGGLDMVVESMLDDLALGRDDALRLMARVGLDAVLWQQVAATYGYRPDTPGINDFAITLFKSCYLAALGGTSSLGPEALVFFRRWKDNRKTITAFETLSALYAVELGIETSLADRDYRQLGAADHFEVIDQRFIGALVADLSARTASPTEALALIRQRRQCHWFEKYRHVYEAITHAVTFQQTLTQTTLGMMSLAEGVTRYATTWFMVDQLYRKFVFHAQESGQASLLGPLADEVENHYVNTYLLRLNDSWQKHLDAAPVWAAEGIVSQRTFYRDHVAAFRRKDQRICVIISDALRYEIAEDLLTRVRSIDKFEASISPMLGSLPSYTQLGMAALLPNKSLEIADNDTSTVLVDGHSSQGLENRRKILARGRDGDRTGAWKYEEVMNFNRDDMRALLTDHDVLYIYHNVIDATGDKPATEDRVFDAAETAIEDIVKLTKKLVNANASNVIVTADHGFIYQHRPIEESDFSLAEVAGETILFRDRRFILGHGLKPQHGLKRLTPAEAGLEGTVEMLIPKSINRLRRQGSGSRFVHGGATLQEIVVPVVTIAKKRQSDVSQVEVEIISGNRQITTGQANVTFYQTAPTSEKVHGRTLRIGLYSDTGQLISDTHTKDFDMRAESPRDREVPLRFLLSKDAEKYNNKEILLRLEEPVRDTSHYRLYRETRYTLRRTFSSDFDF